SQRGRRGPGRVPDGQPSTNLVVQARPRTAASRTTGTVARRPRSSLSSRTSLGDPDRHRRSLCCEHPLQRRRLSPRGPSALRGTGRKPFVGAAAAMMTPVDQLREMIANARRAVIFTGAGISTESGIPDFRSPGGIWTRFKPIYYQDFVSSIEARRETWRRKIETDKSMRVAEPNRGHHAVAALVRRGIVSHVITQNIDGLHQRSGIPAEQVIELHGNATYAKCLECGRRHDIEAIKADFARDENLPVCAGCGSDMVKT